MSETPESLPLPDFDSARVKWRRDYARQTAAEEPRRNRSGIVIKPLYTPDDWSDRDYLGELGFPGQLPMTRGIYPTMHRGRTWSQRQLIGFGTPRDYNRRLKVILEGGGTAASLIPCNSVYRGYDCDEVDPRLLGTCGTVVNSVEDMDECYRDIELGKLSTALNDPLPFTLLALLLAVARRRNIPWTKMTGTSNQSDYISHFVANHMFFRIALPGSRRVLLDHVAYCQKHLPGWNPVSVVGQHMQQGGATPAEAMALTLSTAIQYAGDCIDRGIDPDRFLPRFTFFFDVSVSFFEEIAKFRAGRRLWQRIVRERFGAKNPKSWRFKFHAQTSGVDLTRQQPLNNIARVTVQAMAGIFGGLQSLHADSYDEVLSVPTEEAARVAIATQNILREEARLVDVIDPLGGSYYVETLTNQMQEQIERLIARIDAAGGMYAAAESGIPQTIMSRSALAFQDRVDSGAETIVGVNKGRLEEPEEHKPAPLQRPRRKTIEAHIARLRAFKKERSQARLGAALDALAQAANAEPAPDQNVFEKAVEAAEAGATHGEICACLRREMGFGEPLILG
ncbi:MAG: methylmalonyl-CoA mutase family protein [Kiloniellales bacterium]